MEALYFWSSLLDRSIANEFERDITSTTSTLAPNLEAFLGLLHVQRKLCSSKRFNFRKPALT